MNTFDTETAPVVPEWRNPAFNAAGGIDAEILIGGRWVPFSVDPADTGAAVDVVGLDAAIRAGDQIAPYVAPPAPDLAAADLSAPRFAYLLAYSGLGEVWDALAEELKSTDRAAYALLIGQRAQQRFRLSVTLDFVQRFAGIAATVAPGVDLSETAIRAAWAQAAAAEI